MVKMQTKLNRYIGLILLIVIVGIFVHSEILNECHVDEHHEQHDYCNIVSNSTTHLQNSIKYNVDNFILVLPSIDIFTDYKETYSISFNKSVTPLADISRTILFQSFLI